METASTVPVSLSPKSYRWGKFQGWCLTVVVPAVALLATLTHAYEVAAILAMLSLLGVPLGVGLLRKKRYALTLVYVALGMSCLSVIWGFIKTAMGFPSPLGVPSVVMWAISAIYYRRRRDEFS